jgi:hypothetical protein
MLEKDTILCYNGGTFGKASFDYTITRGLEIENQDHTFLKSTYNYIVGIVCHYGAYIHHLMWRRR